MNLSRALMWIATAVEHAAKASAHTAAMVRAAIAKVRMLLMLQRAASC